ncbi:general odorant-binding protein 83a-like [Aethina tumida]|uniref:general odorant-binding protein 83a-like n=1 Tax=Aethina tumida TaxID=116153 RepID=UPI00096B4FA7|nr:general odorant-binding protein 83a-like [Aethina tumida]
MYAKSVIILLFISVIYAKLELESLPDKTKDYIVNLRDTCTDESGVESALIDAAKQGQISDDENLKCYAKCVLTESSLMDDKGQINTTVLDDLLPEDVRMNVKATLESCGLLADQDDLCERAHNISKCSFREQLVYI